MFISIGPNCHTAGVLKIKKIKEESYPFDWIISDIDVVINCIKDDFFEYLNKDNYYLNTEYKDQNIIGHKKYKKNMFVHRDPLNNCEDYSYLERCVDRFKIEMSNNKNKYLCLTSYNDNYDIKKIESLITIVKNKYNSFFTIIIMNYNNSLCVKNTYNCETMENILLYTILINYDKTDNLSLTKNINNFHENINIFNK